MLQRIFNWIGLIFCKIGWHGDLEHMEFDGASHRARCARCGQEGMIDSQGNLF